ncbi:MAG: TonB family protein [candidate division WOR-3 bacterium]
MAAILLVLSRVRLRKVGIGLEPGRDSAATVIHSLVKPRYPGVLLSRRPDGRVVVKVQVDTSGRVRAAVVVRSSGVAELDAAALDAAECSRFSARFENGRRVRYQVALAYEFDGSKAEAWVSSLRQSEAVLMLRPDTVVTAPIEECDEPPVLLEDLSFGRAAPDGTVKARVMVEADGRAGRVELLDSGFNVERDSQVLRWLRVAKFRAGRRNGRPVRVWLTVEL